MFFENAKAVFKEKKAMRNTKQVLIANKYSKKSGGNTILIFGKFFRIRTSDMCLKDFTERASVICLQSEILVILQVYTGHFRV